MSETYSLFNLLVSLNGGVEVRVSRHDVWLLRWGLVVVVEGQGGTLRKLIQDLTVSASAAYTGKKSYRWL